MLFRVSSSLALALISFPLLLRLFHFLRLIFNPCKISENLSSFFGQLCFPPQLHLKELLDHFVKLRATWNSQSIEFPHRQRLAQWTPFLDVAAKLGYCAGIGHFRFDESHHFGGQRCDVEVCVLRSIRLPSFQHL